MLPKIKHVTFDVPLISIDKTVKCRPFTVEEEKLFLMAKEESDAKTIYDTVLQVVNNCIVTPGIDVTKLASFDIEYIIVKIRSKSVGEIVELKYKWGDEEIPVDINLDEVELTHTKGHTRKFMITDDIGLVMRYPGLDVLLTPENIKKDEYLIDNICTCIETIFDNENVYDEYTKEELVEFVTSLPTSSLKKITEFFKTMPTLNHTITVKNKEGTEKVVTLRGLSDFFIL